MEEGKQFKQDSLYKILYSEIPGEFKSPKGYISGYDQNFVHLTFKDGKTKSINLKMVISITELGEEEDGR